MESPTTKPPLAQRMFKNAIRADLVYIAVILLIGALVWLIF